RSALEKAGVGLNGFPSFARYLNYLEAADAVDAAQVFAGIASMESDAYGRLARNAADRRWAAASRFLTLASKLEDFTLSPSEWATYGKVRNEDRSAPELHAALRTFESFYEAAEARNGRLADNLLRT